MNNLTKIAVLATAAFAAVAAQAQSIRYVMLRGNTVYEVVPGSAGGGRFIANPHTVGGIYCAGTTDRVVRNGELYAAIVLPTSTGSTAKEIGYTVNGALRWRKTGSLGLPWLYAGWVSCNPNDDNTEWYAKVGNNTAKLRLPVGTRP